MFADDETAASAVWKTNQLDKQIRGKLCVKRAMTNCASEHAEANCAAAASHAKSMTYKVSE